MCLTTTTPIPKVAGKSIICYKYGTIDNHIFFTRMYYSIGEKVPTVKLDPIGPFFHNTFTVHEGYHTFNTVKGLREETPHPHNIGVFVIPAGSLYIDGWYNDSKDIANRVSNQIIYLGNIYNPITWLRVLRHKLF